MGDFATGGFSLFTGVTAKNLKNFALKWDCARAAAG
jgi:hypothetical protein